MKNNTPLITDIDRSIEKPLDILCANKMINSRISKTNVFNFSVSKYLEDKYEQKSSIMKKNRLKVFKKVHFRIWIREILQFLVYWIRLRDVYGI